MWATALDGELQHSRTTTTEHGTAFAYKRQGDATLLLTNEHVAEFPTVTGASHRLSDVPSGCKKVSESTSIVDNDTDDYERDDIRLSRVAVDVSLDAAVLKAPVALPLMPWKIGRSAALKERNVVMVRGFPLGVFRATSVGKVTSAFDHDEYKDWDHNDFAIDALLSEGNSGSPVFAISCRTGEFELVGLFHAAYSRGQALNVAISIDQLREFMDDFAHPKQKNADVVLDNTARQSVAADITHWPEPFFALGSLPAVVRLRADQALIFEVFGAGFPMQNGPLLVLEDLPPRGNSGFGNLGRVWVGDEMGLRPYQRAELDAETQSDLSKILDVLRRDALGAFAYKRLTVDAASSRINYETFSRREKRLNAIAAAQRDSSQLVKDVASRLPDDRSTVNLREVFATQMLAAPPLEVHSTATANAAAPHTN